jgi:hypothetical protein
VRARSARARRALSPSSCPASRKSHPLPCFSSVPPSPLLLIRATILLSPPVSCCHAPLFWLPSLSADRAPHRLPSPLCKSWSTSLPWSPSLSQHISTILTGASPCHLRVSESPLRLYPSSSDQPRAWNLAAPVRRGQGVITVKTFSSVGQPSPTGSRVMPRAPPAAAAHRWDPPPLSPLHSGVSLPRTPCPVGAPQFSESHHGGILLRWPPERRHVASMRAVGLWARQAMHTVSAGLGRPWVHCGAGPHAGFGPVFNGGGGKEIPFPFPRFVKSISNFNNS